MIPNVGRTWRNWNFHTQLVGMQNGTTIEKKPSDRLLKVKYTPSIGSNLNLGIHPKGVKT